MTVLLAKENVVAVACGSNFTMAITNRGEMYGWGHNVPGQVCCGNRKICHAPTLVLKNGHIHVVQVSCGYHHTLALDNERKVYSWGKKKLFLPTGKGRLRGQKSPHSHRHHSIKGATSCHIWDDICDTSLRWKDLYVWTLE